MRRSGFYFMVVLLVVLNGYLLSKPNLLGKIGLIVYKYYYLRTFPRTLLTVSIVCLIAAALAELITLLVRKSILNRPVATALFIIFVALGFVQLFITGVDFGKWTYSHTGLRFRLGAFMLPTLVIFIFGHGWLRLPKIEVVETRRERRIVEDPLAEDKVVVTEQTTVLREVSQREDN